MQFSISRLLTVLCLLSLSVSFTASISTHENFSLCFSSHFSSDHTLSQVLYTPNTTSYSSLLQSTIINLRFQSPSEPKPLFIIAPTNISHVQAAVVCSRKHGLRTRVRSGGHDYEGQSYLSTAPYVVIDLSGLRSVDVDLNDKSAWVQAGATLGEVYYKIAERSAVHGFSAGTCSTLGMGGHISGGGIGTMMRKYGTAADNIIDAYIVDANGRVLNKDTMGAELFWAIRGGGGASFGVIVAWKIKLVPVPPKVTVFNVRRTLEQDAMRIWNRWQYVGDKLHENLFIRVIISPLFVEKQGQRVRTNQVQFESLFLGNASALLALMEENFPELGLQQEDCEEMSWIRSALSFAGFPSGEGDPTNVLLDRVYHNKNAFKNKSDFVKEPISLEGLQGIWDRILERSGVFMIMEPFGGRMSEIPEDEIAFPHRRGNLYNIQYGVTWGGNETEKAAGNIKWIRRLHGFLGSYVSKVPRSAYLNYRDLDLGRHQEGVASSTRAFSAWGKMYFNNNLKRLALVKGSVDPDNFFRDEQSIVPLIVKGKKASDTVF